MNRNIAIARSHIDQAKAWRSGQHAALAAGVGVPLRRRHLPPDITEPMTGLMPDPLSNPYPVMTCEKAEHPWRPRN